MDTSPDVTQLLLAWSDGDRDALEKLPPLVYRELKRLAGSYLRRERAGHTLQPTALAHEAYIRLVDQQNVRWQNRAHFFGIAAQAMRGAFAMNGKSWPRSTTRTSRGCSTAARPTTACLTSSWSISRACRYTASATRGG